MCVQLQFVTWLLFVAWLTCVYGWFLAYLGFVEGWLWLVQGFVLGLLKVGLGV